MFGFGFESSAARDSKKKKVVPTDVDPVVQQVLREVEGREASRFHGSELAANTSLYIDSELPEVSDSDMGAFDALVKGTPAIKPSETVLTDDLSLEPLPKGDAKDWAFEAARQASLKSSQEHFADTRVGAEKTADAILRAKELLDDAERRVDEAEERYAQAETDRIGWQGDVSSQQKLVEASRVSAELKTELGKRMENARKMRAAYDQVAKVILH